MADESPARASTPINIFISYRRDDAAGQAISLRTELSQRFGPEHVFMDVADLRPGENFVKVIQDHVARCDVLIALLGGRWASIHGRTNETQRPRIHGGLRQGRARVGAAARLARPSSSGA